MKPANSGKKETIPSRCRKRRNYAVVEEGELPLNSIRVAEGTLTLCTNHATEEALAAYPTAKREAGMTLAYRLAFPVAVRTAPLFIPAA